MDKTEELQIRCVSHEIRNQISICEMYSEIIKKHIERENIKNDSIDNGIECIKKALKIISNSLIDLKTMNSLDLKAANLEEIIEEGIRLSDAYTQGKEINIKLNQNDKAQVYIDENKFLACIVNIIKNGVEAIEKTGEIVVTSKIKNNEAYITISNNGRMISKEKQEEIFKEGFTTKPTGSGLGLHICRKNLEAQNATLELLQSTDKLTEFLIKIPVYTSR